MNDLIINGKDAFVTWGVRMGDGFLDAIEPFPTMKSDVDNESRLEDGKRVIAFNRKVSSNDVTLTFTLEGKDTADFVKKKDAFIEVLKEKEITVCIPLNSEKVYRLLYRQGTSYAQNTQRTFCKVACKFNEANPMNRAPEKEP